MGIAFLKYTLARIGLLVVFAAMLWPLGLNPYLTIMVALLASLPASYFLFRRLRHQLAEAMAEDSGRRREQRDSLRAALAGEDGEGASQPAPRKSSENDTFPESSPSSVDNAQESRNDGARST